MKAGIENVTVNRNTYYRITTSTGRSVRLYYSTDDTNCKLSYIHSVGSLVGMIDNDKKEVIDTILRVSKGAVILNSTKKAITDWIAKNYEVYYYNRVPIGYSNTFQYHICIRNSIMPNPYCLKPTVKITEDINQQEVNSNNLKYNKSSIRNKLKKLLKSLRRKDDYVDSFVDSL